MPRGECVYIRCHAPSLARCGPPLVVPADLCIRPSAACPRSLWGGHLYGNDLTAKSVPALAAALAHLPNLKVL